MARMRIDADGIKIARQGHDVDTASMADILFTSDFSALRLAEKGTAVIGSYSGFMSSRYDRAIVNFSAPYPKPPIVLVSGIISSTECEQFPGHLLTVPLTNGVAGVYPLYSIETYTDRFELYVYQRGPLGDPSGPPTTQWRYFVFDHTLAD